MAAPIKARMNRLPQGVTLAVQVQMARRLLVRIWIAKRLIRLAAWIAQVDIEMCEIPPMEEIEPLNEVCIHGCHEHPVYGFVPMAGCPFHD